MVPPTQEPESGTEPKAGELPTQIPSDLLQPDVAAEDTLRAQNKSRTKSVGDVQDLVDLFIPPTAEKKEDPPPEENQDFPPLPLSFPTMRTSETSDDKPPSHRRMPSSIRLKPGHERQVSWGLDNFDRGVPMSAFADVDRVHQENASGRISLEDVQNVRPMENEAQACILKALESRDIHGEKEMQESGSVLTNIDREDLAALRPEQDSSITSSSLRSKETSRPPKDGSSKAVEENPVGRPASVRRNVSKGTQVHRRIGTVGDTLELLTASMDALHTQNIDFVTDLEDDSVLPAPLQQNKPETVFDGTHAADTLHQNANMLFNRHRTRSQSTGSVRDEEMGDVSLNSPLNEVKSDDSLSAGTPSSRKWTLLRSTTHQATKSAVSENGSVEDLSLDTTIGKIEEENENGDEASSDENAPPLKKDQESANRPPSQENTQHVPFKLQRSKSKFITELDDFFSPRRRVISSFLRTVVCLIMLPSMAIAALLFYLAGNPPTGIIDLDVNSTSSGDGQLINTNGEYVDPQQASASWWLLFVGSRQVITFVLAKAVELVFIDFLSVRSKFALRFLGPWATLFILQMKGWPFLLFCWGVFNSALLSGTKPFFHHWGYWQDYVELFNRANPSGNVVNDPQWHQLIIISIVVGLVVSLKRFWLGLYLGRQTFVQYSEKLAETMKCIVLVSEVASLGRRFERQKQNGEERASITAASFGLNQERFQVLMDNSDDSTAGGGNRTEGGESMSTMVFDPNDRLPLTGSLSAAQKSRISQLLGQWEEPAISQESDRATKATVSELLQFRRALGYLHTPFPFSGSFGIADTRESTIESSQEVYTRLLYRSPDPQVLQFDVIAILGVKKDGKLDQEKLKNLIKLFRPDRDGKLSGVVFAKAVDKVYRELRLLRASVANSTKIDRAFESIFNVVFYAIVISIVLSQLGYDPLAIFISFSGVILAFAFMIGSASSKYFEGLLFIIVRRPYNIGDGIAVSNVNDELEPGSPFWIVEDVDLFTTKVIYHRSFERATVSNGSLANSRVVNATLSTQAKIIVKLKFPVSVPYEKLTIFHDALEQYFRNRPREWSALLKFVMVRIEADMGYAEYAIIGRHRSAWVQYAEILQSRADLMAFSMELSKKLDIWYRNPPLPVDLNMTGFGGTGTGPSNFQQLLQQNLSSSSVSAEPVLGPTTGGTGLQAARSPRSEGNSETRPLVSFADDVQTRIDLKDLQNQFRPRGYS